ncbi:hypothetical protein FHX82_003326 [Amycolatopsis bartoniae]|uniref:Uncharacterized protein n=1 Tax=Amycolatopsis bartoniae TaxID=941986 RepID=A0A8H9J2N9_9PSEU|nr:CapA family protein [Amycolatopsis bartoniae]MBB2936272.1 hypothetical protein [Amycolatopsis bartoniae]TVT11569.1 CapA family protein [Amycolatopsis bartoniae]GHF79008.1 hypothetical protein GCM10017566_61450 [Amycolatopsis bartoniae]
MDLTIMGDLVVSGRPPRPVAEPGGPGDPAFGLLQGGDLTIGDLEVPLTESGQRAGKLVTMRACAGLGAGELAHSVSTWCP